MNLEDRVYQIIDGQHFKPNKLRWTARSSWSICTRYVGLIVCACRPKDPVYALMVGGTCAMTLAVESWSCLAFAILFGRGLRRWR